MIPTPAPLSGLSTRGLWRSEKEIRVLPSAYAMRSKLGQGNTATTVIGLDLTATYYTINSWVAE